MPEFEAPPAEDLVHQRAAEGESQAVIALREARKKIPSLPRIAVHFARPSDPDARLRPRICWWRRWRDLGLGARGRRRHDARFVRLAAPVSASRGAASLGAGKLVVPIAWVGRRAPGLAPGSRLARGRARLGRLHARERALNAGPEPTPVTSKRAVATAGESIPVG